MPRWEGHSKANGSAIFGIDSRVPGMQFAVVARCPVFGGKVKSFDAAKAKAVTGVREVFAIEPVGTGAFTAGGVAIVADNSWAAMQGRKALQVSWEEGPHANESSDTLHQQFLANAGKPGKTVRNDGDADAALASASKKGEVSYEFPFAARSMRRVGLRHGNISRLQRRLKRCGIRKARRIRKSQSLRRRPLFRIRLRIIAWNIRSLSPECRAHGGVQSNIQPAASSWNVLSMSLRLPPVLIRLNSVCA